MVKELEKLGVKVVADISTDPGQVDFSGAVLKAKQSNADALFVYTNEEESARALRELRKQGYDKPIVGETVLTSQKVIELAGDAANGAVAHVGLTADAPQPADQGVRPEVPGGIQVQGRPQRAQGLQRDVHREGADREARQGRSEGVRQRRCTAPSSRSRTIPGVLLDVTFDNNGDLDRESFMTKVVNGKQEVVATLPPASAK